MRYPVTGDLLTPKAAKDYKRFCKEVGSETQAASIIIRAGLSKVMDGYAKRAEVTAAAAKADAAAAAKRQEELAALKLEQEATERAAAEELAEHAAAIARGEDPDAEEPETAEEDIIHDEEEG